MGLDPLRVMGCGGRSRSSPGGRAAAGVEKLNSSQGRARASSVVGSYLQGDEPCRHRPPFRVPPPEPLRARRGRLARPARRPLRAGSPRGADGAGSHRRGRRGRRLRCRSRAPDSRECGPSTASPVQAGFTPSQVEAGFELPFSFAGRAQRQHDPRPQGGKGGGDLARQRRLHPCKAAPRRPWRTPRPHGPGTPSASGSRSAESISEMKTRRRRPSSRAMRNSSSVMARAVRSRSGHGAAAAVEEADVGVAALDLVRQSISDGARLGDLALGQHRFQTHQPRRVGRELPQVEHAAEDGGDEDPSEIHIAPSGDSLVYQSCKHDRRRQAGENGASPGRSSAPTHQKNS